MAMVVVNDGRHSPNQMHTCRSAHHWSAIVCWGGIRGLGYSTGVCYWQG